MKDMRIIGVLVMAGCAALGGCRKKVDPMGDAVKQSPEGKLCPPGEGMISDGEANSNQTNTIKGRGGYWYTFLDKVGSTVTPTAGEQGGTFFMTPGGGNGTKFAACMKGTIGTGDIVYAGMGLNFVDPKGQYDSSKYQGVSFWAKKGPGSTARVRLKMPDKNTEPDGKVCSECFNDFGMDLTLTDQWQQFTIPFSAMKQLPGWGNPHTSGIDTATLYGMQWQVNDKGAQYDVCIDEVQFTGCP